VVVDLNGKTVEGSLRPSSDLPTHLILYGAFPAVGGIAHAHSRYATSWAQAQREIRCLGTTHADYFHGPVPVTKPLRPSQIHSGCEANTGGAIVRRFAKLDPLHFPAVLVAGRAPFCWGQKTSAEAHIMSSFSRELQRWHSARSWANPKTRRLSKHLHATSCASMVQTHTTARNNR
jgi:L-ribulose-5-phosphate 4-epimerase